jgi:hypothetical protein
MDPAVDHVAEQVRAALVQAAMTAYEDASLRGLCSEGAWEVAISAMQRLDLTPLITRLNPDSTRSPHT